MSTTSPGLTAPTAGGRAADTPGRPRERLQQARPATPRLELAGASTMARRWAAAILEVLAGVRTPPQAAAALTVSLPRYYVGELRALQGLLAACEPRPKGRVRTPADELARLRREADQLRRQCARQQSLLRVAQRAVGLPAAAPAAPVRGAAKKQRQRRPTVRALRVAAGLREGEQNHDPGAGVKDKGVTA
jgi:hypothetical protein